jgi:hypothetical protein
MADPYISREAVAVLGAKVEALFPLDTLQEGFQLLMNSAIKHIWVDDFFIVHAILTDDKDYKLQLDLDFFLASECACQTTKHCRHIAAVFFLLYSQHGQPDLWLMQVRTSHASSMAKPASTASSNNHHAWIIKDLQELSFDDLEQWPVLLEKEYDKLYRRSNDRFRIDIFYFTAYKKLCAFADHWQPTEVAIFRLYTAIFVLVKAERHFDKLIQDYPHSYYNKVTVDLNDHFLDKIMDAIQRIDTAVFQQEQRPYGEVIRNLLRQAEALHTQNAFDWVSIQRYVWTHLLFDVDWMQLESEYLGRIVNDRDVAPIVASRAAMTATQLYWLLGDDDNAMRLLAHPLISPIHIAVSYLEAHFKSGSWNRLGKWLTFILPYLRRASADQFHRVLSYWREHAKQTHSEIQFRQALITLLPRSYPQFTDFLLKTHQYEEWVYFHLLNGITPSKIDRSQLKQVETQDVQMVLPLYHHAVERQMALRNRLAYRESVKLLKKLKEYYMLANDSQRFELFVRELSVRHQRLHAFQEELEKGRLLR